MVAFKSAPPQPDDSAQLWFWIHQVSGLLDRWGDAMLRANLSVSLARFLVLSVIDAHPGALNQQAIADRVGLTKGSVSRQIAAGVAAGLVRVELSPHSRREKLVELTEAGKQLVRKGDELVDQTRSAQLASLPRSDVAATMRTLISVYRGLTKTEPAAGIADMLT